MEFRNEAGLCVDETNKWISFSYRMQAVNDKANECNLTWHIRCEKERIKKNQLIRSINEKKTKNKFSWKINYIKASNWVNR